IFRLGGAALFRALGLAAFSFFLVLGAFLLSLHHFVLHALLFFRCPLSGKRDSVFTDQLEDWLTISDGKDFVDLYRLFLDLAAIIDLSRCFFLQVGVFRGALFQRVLVARDLAHQRRYIECFISWRRIEGGVSDSLVVADALQQKSQSPRTARIQVLTLWLLKIFLSRIIAKDSRRLSHIIPDL